jgi:hypothetical protein
MFGPMLKPKGFDDLDHERDITLAIHAAVPDLIRDTNRHVSGTVRVELTGEARLAGKVI